MKKLFIGFVVSLLMVGSGYAATLNIGVASEVVSLDPYYHNETATSSC